MIIIRSKLGIDPSLSARIEQDERKVMTASAIAKSHTMDPIETTSILVINIFITINRIDFIERKTDNTEHGDTEENERKKRAQLLADAATRRISQDNTNKPAISVMHVNRNFISSHFCLTKFSLGRSIDYTS